MARRSVRITLSNNSPFKLTLLGASGPCHGIWTDSLQPPSQIAPKTHGIWQSESSGIATGTEGWVKYLIENTDFDTTGKPCLHELVYIHWDNPFIWSHDTKPIDFNVSTSDITPPCDADQGQGGGSTFGASLHGGMSSQNCQHELFGAGASGTGLEGITWWDVVVNWPVLLVFNFTGDEDINFEFTLGLRQKGSVDETIFSFYDGSRGLRSLASMARQSSFRKLFHM